MLSNINSLELEQICARLSLEDVSALSQISKFLRLTLLTDEEIWRVQYLREASKFSLNLTGTPVSWRLIYMIQKSRKYKLTYLNSLFQKQISLDFSSSFGIPVKVVGNFVQTSDGNLCKLGPKPGTIYGLFLNEEISDNNQKIRDIVENGDDLLILTNSGCVYQMNITTLQVDTIYNFANIQEIQHFSSETIWRSKNGQVFVLGKNLNTIFGPSIANTEEITQPKLLPFNEPITWICLSGTLFPKSSQHFPKVPGNDLNCGAGYGTADGGFYFGGKIGYPAGNVSVTCWVNFPRPSAQESFKSIAVLPTQLFGLTTGGKIYWTQLQDCQTFIPFQLLPGLPLVSKIQTHQNNLLICTLSGLVYSLSAGSMTPLPLNGVDYLGGPDSYWITSNYIQLDSITLKAISPLIISRELTGIKDILVDCSGNRYVH